MELQKEQLPLRTAVVAGSTGLVGSELLKQLAHCEKYESVHSLARKEPEFSHQKITNHTVDFEELASLSSISEADDAFCCLGTTMNKAGSKEAFYQVDFEYVKLFAEYALQIGCKRFFLISALGADKESMMYYNKVKGEIEEEVMSMGFETTHIFRPSLLIGERDELRVGENIGQKFAKWFDFAIPSKYKAVSAQEVASFMCQKACKLDTKEIQIHESEEMLSR